MEVTPDMDHADRLIDTAAAEVGYLEKRTNSRLDEKAANAGGGNYTRYNRDLKAWTGVGSLNAQWCQAFVDWCFITAFGVEDAKKLLYTFTNYTPTGSDAFKKRGRYIRRGAGVPRPGDVIYFYSKAKGRIGHVGIVYRVSASKVYTIEGNATDRVKKKSYALTNAYIDGYGSVDYEQLGDPTRVRVTGGSVFLRVGPGVEHTALGVAHRGDTFPWLGETAENGWQRVDHDGTPAWISGKYARLE